MLRPSARVLCRTVAVAALALAGLSCQDNTGDTIIVNGLDCGLIRQQLDGNWSVTYTPGSAVTQGCDNIAWNGMIVTVAGGTVIYSNPDVFASPSGVSFNVVAPGPFGKPNELMASVEADSCLGLVQTWEDDESGWVQCIGTVDLTTHQMGGICDSFDIDTDGNGAADVACDLDHSLLATIVIP